MTPEAVPDVSFPTPPEPVLSGELERICYCESGLRQFNEDGTVLRGRVNSQDVGICQINLKYHQAAAEELGLDLFTEEGNIQYAQWLYEREGSRPWLWSRSCWQTIVES